MMLSRLGYGTYRESMPEIFCLAQEGASIYELAKSIEALPG